MKGKHCFFYLIILFVPSQLFGQNEKVTGYDEDTNRKFIANYTDNYLNGQYSEFKGKKKVLEGNFSMGFRSGTWYYYYENGKTAIQVHYNDNELNGIAKEFDKKGRIRAKMNYKNNLRHGECRFYLPKKNDLFRVANYHEGKLDGKVIDYGETKMVINYSKGKRSGKSGFIDIDGDFKKITEYKDGEVVDDYTVYDISLNPIERYVINTDGVFHKKILFEGNQVLKEISLDSIDTSFMYTKYIWEEQAEKILLIRLENNETNTLAPIYYSE